MHAISHGLAQLDAKRADPKVSHGTLHRSTGSGYVSECRMWSITFFRDGHTPFPQVIRLWNVGISTNHTMLC